MRKVSGGTAGHAARARARTGAAGADVAAAAAAVDAAGAGGQQQRAADDQLHLRIQSTLVDNVVHLVGALVVQAASVPLDDLVAWDQQAIVAIVVDIVNVCECNEAMQKHRYRDREREKKKDRDSLRDEQWNNVDSIRVRRVKIKQEEIRVEVSDLVSS